MINRLDSHSHTIASGHAYNTVMEMASAAAEKGLELLAITEHSKTIPGACDDLYFLNLKVLPRTLYGIEVLFGAEANIIDYTGKLDLKESILRKLDVCIASLHTPCIRAGTMEENTQACLGAIENPFVNILGHPDDGRYPLDFDTVTAAAAEHRVLVELNNSSLRPGCSRKNSRENMIALLECCRKYKARVILNSDAHWCDDVGKTNYTEPLLEETGFPEELIVNRSVELYKTYINRFRMAENGRTA